MSGGQRVFVAGASGVIGRVLCPMLVADGWQVTGSTRHAGRADALARQGVVPAVVDVFVAAQVHEAIARARPAALVHLVTDLPDRWDPAAREEVLEGNARVREQGTRHLVDACAAAGVECVVAQSIAFVYAPGPEPHDESAPLDVEAADPVTARTAGAVGVLEDLVLSGPFRGVVLRFGQLYGPGTWTSIPPRGAPVHVEAAADAARRALRLGEPGTYNVAEEDGAVSSARAMAQLGWRPTFRVGAG